VLVVDDDKKVVADEKEEDDNGDEKVGVMADDDDDELDCDGEGRNDRMPTGLNESTELTRRRRRIGKHDECMPSLLRVSL
jgi:hypothetical protein